ncbi:MAG TPA: FTR1 family protein [Patescibacteria group bacterium]|nr:FTR1 family protein [Patescibacteria group bacterium]
MFGSFLITFRETLEAALVVGIVLTFLTRTNQPFFKQFVWRGVGIGIVAAVFLAIILEIFFGGLSGKTEEIFEGVLMFITAGFLTWMIMWVHKQKDVAKKIKEKVKFHVEKGYGWGILILVATAVFREGTETVLYLKASSLVGQTGQLTGAFLGIAAALLLGYGLFAWALRVNIQRVFMITSIFLIMFAAGLVSHGIHEFQEVGWLPIFSFDPIYNISHILDNGSVLGSLLRTLFGYTSNPTILEIIFYASYIFFIVWLQRATDRKLLKK